MKYLIIIAFVLLAIFIVPALVLWSLNTLFPALAIPYTLQTLVAALILTLVFVPYVKK